MSLFTTPCMYINLGGEMLFILEQRLEAQGLSETKHQKVMKDMIGYFMDDRNLSTMFTPQPLLNKKLLKQNFSKLVLASTLTLSKDAMDKLFDLMIMAMKYKVMLCKSGHELLMLTLSHLDAIRLLVEGIPTHIDMVNKVLGKCVELYHVKLSNAQMELVRQTILNFFQNSHTKVAIFLKEKIQLPNGKFVIPQKGTVPFGSEIPGRITYLYNKDHKIDVVPLTVQYYRIEKEGSYDEMGDRQSSSHVKLYEPEKKKRKEHCSSSPLIQHSISSKEEGSSKGDSVGHAELDLLQGLLIGFKSPSETQQQPFKLTLFEDDSSLDSSKDKKISQSKSSSERNTIKIDSTQSTSTTIMMKQMLQDFDDKNSITDPSETKQLERGDDLLSLMDTL